MIVVLLGPPGAGKGTQGEKLAACLGVAKLATGDVLRDAVRRGTPQGLAAKSAMDRGDLVPDDVILGIMKEALGAPSAERGVVLDGVVRTVTQAEGLQTVLRDLGRTLDGVIVFDVDAEELVARLGGRTVCTNCQTPYTGRPAGSRCDKCGGALVTRKDDEPDAVRNRLSVYQRQTAPVIAWYRSNGGRVHTIDATGSIDTVFARLTRSLDVTCDSA
ncbi:MAG: adenylate kinase [Gemmatimonadaceae bacterium]